jgi:hypothetical protein
MRNVDISLVSGWAGAALIAVPALELLLDGGAPGFVHAVLGGFGLALFAVAAAADARR